MKQNVLLIIGILIPFLALGQDINGIWNGKGVQKIGNKLFHHTIEVHLKQEKGNTVSGKMLKVQTGTKNHSISTFSGTIKNGKVKIYPEKILKIDYPETNFDLLCFRHYTGDFTIDEKNNLLVIEVESYGIDLTYHLLTKVYSDGNCPPSIFRITKKYGDADNQNVVAEGAISPSMTDNIEMVVIDKKEVKLFTETVKIKVWDNHEEDGDLINLYLNGKLLFSNLEVTKKGEVFEVQLTSGVNIIEVEALNEGKVSPNTSALRIFTSTEEHDIILSARKGQKDALKIILD